MLTNQENVSKQKQIKNRIIHILRLIVFIFILILRF